MTAMTASTSTAPTRFLDVANERYAYRRCGNASAHSLLCLQTHTFACLDGLVYPDAGHGSLFQWRESFYNQVSRFLALDSPFAPY